MSVPTDAAAPSARGAARAPYVVPCEGEGPYGLRFALVDSAGRLVRRPDLSWVGEFAPDGRGGHLVPARDLAERSSPPNPGGSASPTR
ncbi:hypothetical protein ACWCXH_10750 [Kitasatospora sp. NPDC001660]